MSAPKSPQAAGSNCRIGIEDPKNVGNVGNVLRAAGCFGASEVCYTGTRYDRAYRFADAASKHLEEVRLRKVDSLLEACPPGYTRVAVELALGAQALPDYVHPPLAYYIFGPEDRSLEQTTLDACDEVVYIPAANCLNLAASVNVLLYDRSVKSGTFEPGDALIKRSRDNRNRLRCK